MNLNTSSWAFNGLRNMTRDVEVKGQLHDTRSMGDEETETSDAGS